MKLLYRVLCSFAMEGPISCWSCSLWRAEMSIVARSQGSYVVSSDSTKIKTSKIKKLLNQILDSISFIIPIIYTYFCAHQSTRPSINHGTITAIQLNLNFTTQASHSMPQRQNNQYTHTIRHPPASSALIIDELQL